MLYFSQLTQRVLRACEALSRPVLKRILSPKAFEAVTFWLRLGYWPHLDNPRSFNEHISNRKLYEHPFPHPERVDKLSVRSYVENLLGTTFLTQILTVYESPEQIILADLPRSFMLKSNTGSGMNFSVSDKSHFTEVKLRDICRPWFQAVYSKVSHSNERMYDEITPRVFAEELLDAPEMVQEYKFWCFHGKPMFIQVSRVYKGGRIYKLYTTDWTPCDFSVFNPQMDCIFPRPVCLDLMLNASQTLSSPHPFVRVDFLVSSQNRVTFSELTFRPGGGRVRFFPRKMDFDLGANLVSAI